MATRLASGGRGPDARGQGGRGVIDPDRPAVPGPTRALRLPGRGEDAQLLSDYRRLVVRHRTALAAALVTGLLLSVGYLYLTRHEYTSAVQLEVRAAASKTTTLGDTLPLDLTMDGEVAMLHSAAVTGTVAARTGSTAADVDGRLAVTVPPNTRQLRIAFTAGSRKAAQAGAQLVADAYLVARRAQFDALRADQVTRLTAAAKTTGTALAEQTARSTDQELPFSRRTDAGRQAETLRGTLERQQRRVEQLAALDTAAADQISQATPARGPKLVNRMVPLATGLGLGLLGWVLLLPRLGRRRPVNRPADVRDLPDVRLAVSAPPVLKAPDQSARDRAEQTYLRLWAHVVDADPTAPRVVAVLPADVRLAAREVAIDLAAASASRQVRTALAIIGNPPWPLQQALQLEDAVQQGGSHPQGVHVIGESPRIPGLTLVSLRQPAGLATRDGLREGLARLGRSFEHIVVLAPPPGTVEHQSLAWAASVPVLVVDRRHTRLTTVVEVLAELRAAGSDPLWVLLAGSNAPIRRQATPPADDPAGGPAGQPAGPPDSPDAVPAPGTDDPMTPWKDSDG